MSIWLNILMVVLTWIACAAATWGVLTERLRNLGQNQQILARRIESLEAEKFITRVEYENRHKELLDEIRHISRKS